MTDRPALFLVSAAVVAWATLVGPMAQAQVPGAESAGPVVVAQNVETKSSAELGIVEWLTRIHGASRKRAYVGTFVVSSGGNLSSARIWHICDGEQQMVRVESLSGAPRSTFRRNDQVITFFPQTKTAVSEKRVSLALFPELFVAADSAIAQNYFAQRVGSDRVAGLDADIVHLVPKDDLRFGYRVWSEKRTGILLKLQTLDSDGRTLEQAAFSELQLVAPVNMGKLTKLMDNTEGYRVEYPEIVKTSAAAEGWVLKSPVNGFKPVACFKRPGSGADGQTPDNRMQWIFTDGLASLSLFVEPVDRRRHVQEGATSSGATNTLSRRVVDKSGEWWLTLVGEVPRQTLVVFAQGLERRK